MLHREAPYGLTVSNLKQADISLEESRPAEAVLGRRQLDEAQRRCTKLREIGLSPELRGALEAVLPGIMGTGEPADDVAFFTRRPHLAGVLGQDL